MDATAFGCSRDPLQRSSELDDACLPNTLASLLAELQSGLRAPQGLSVLVGPSGSGKSVAASALARRLGAVAHVALLARPTSSVSAIARDALARLGADTGAAATDWVAALRSAVEARAAAGRATVLLLDDAERLSPQALEGLATLFGQSDDEEPLRLHVFLFGREKLLDRMHAGPERVLHAFLLQICRIAPLGVRESVRYLERRLAICGGELTAIFSDEAIDELVQKAEGRMVRLERIAADAMERAAAGGRKRVAAGDVRMPLAEAEPEEEVAVMASRQQPLEFEIEEDEVDGEEEWLAGDEEEDAELAEWDDGEDEEEEWEADGAGDDELVDEPVEEEDLDWDPAPIAASDLVSPERVVLGVPAGADAGRRRLAGRAVLTAAICLGLVWLANNMPTGSSGPKHGRDATLFAEKLTTDPKQIMRLAKNAEAADADSHVEAWLAEPPKPAPRAQTVVAAADKASGSEAAAKPGAADRPAKAADVMAAKTASDGAVAPPAAPDAGPKSAAPPAALASAAPATTTPAKTASAKTPGKTAKPAIVEASASSAKGSSVFTVQLGAFKTRRNAEDLVAKLKTRQARVVRDGSLYRVMSGAFSSRRDATLHEASLKRKGYTTFIRTAVF